MPVGRERIDGLARFGLTEYQARVYLGLQEYGTLKAAQLPAICGVPRSRIYITVQQLQVKGLVRILPERPLRFSAVPFDAFLRAAADEYRSRADYLRSNAEVLAREFSVPPRVPLVEPGRFEAIYGRKNCRERVREMYEGASTEIVGIGSAASAGRWVRILGSRIVGRSVAGVAVKYAFPETPGNHESLRWLGRYVDLRLLDFPFPVVFHGVDGRQFLIFRPYPDNESASEGDDIGLWTDDPMLAQAMTMVARRIWETSRPFPKVFPDEIPTASGRVAAVPAGEVAG